MIDTARKPPDEFTPRDVLALDLKIGDWEMDPVDFYPILVVDVKRFAHMIVIDYAGGRRSRVEPFTRLRVWR